MTYATVLTALADPTRRGLFERMRHRACTVGELATIAKIRQPTVSQHLRVLRGAGLVTDRRGGTCGDSRASSAGLAELRECAAALGDVGVAACMGDRAGAWAVSALAGGVLGAVWNYALSSRFTWGRY